MSRADAENGPQAHAITRWLGCDAPDHTPRTVAVDLDAPGWVLVCSDGLWNYCSEAKDLAALVLELDHGSDPLALADALVDWANTQGGVDNITVALARIGAAPVGSSLTGQPEPQMKEGTDDGNVLG
jgi:serine/threonine protein phosphatase PrpC